MSASNNLATKSITSPDAIALLTDDHKAVKAMFQAYEEIKDRDDADDEKIELVERICAALTIHAMIEEEIFYPAVRKVADDDDLMDVADVEHASEKVLIAQLRAANPGDDHFNAKVTVLGELVDHHVEEEEHEMFPMAKEALRAKGIGIKLARRKAELEDELGLLGDATGDAKSKPASMRGSARGAS